MKYTIIVFSENKPGVLNRISDMLLRRKINIESLTVSETEMTGISRFTIVIEGDKNSVEKVIKQLYKIIEVIKVFEASDEELIFKEISFIKISTSNPQQRDEVEKLSMLMRASVVHIGSDYMVLEKTGTEEEISSLYLLVKPYGIKEFVRSGRIAVKKEEAKQGNLQVLKNPAHVTSLIEVSAIKKIELMSRAEKDCISLAQGIPSFNTPQYIKEGAKKAIDENLSDKYTAGYGIEPLRKALCEKLRRDNNIHVQTSQVIVTHGAIEALMAVFVALLNFNDEIVILTPDYASHITQTIIALHGGKPVFVPLDEKKDWSLDVQKLEGAITQKTKAILLCNPSNPIGKVYTNEELKQIAALALKYNLYIITDEMYEYFTYESTKHISIGSFPEVADRTISIFGFSKSYAMTGWRIGYMVATQSLINQIFKIHDSLVTCPTAVSQYAALAALTGPQDEVQHFRKAFEKRRKIVIDMLSKSSKIKLVSPQGAYYAFPKIEGNVDDYELAARLVKEAKVAVVPGSAFGLGGESHVRISFAGDEEKLREGIHRLIRFINNFY